MLNRIFGRLRTYFAAFFWLGGVFALGGGWAQAAPALDSAIKDTSQELKGVQQDIKAERARLDAVDKQRDAELAKLRLLENQQAEVGRAVYAARVAVANKEELLADLRARHAALDVETAAGLVHLEENLRALYLLGAGHGLEGVLSPGGRADKMRVEGYLAELRTSRLEALNRLRVARADNARVQLEIESTLEELTRMQLQAESEQAALDRLRAQHAKVVDTLESRYSAVEAKVRQMSADQNALERALQKLERELAEADALAEKQQREAKLLERKQQEEEQQKRAVRERQAEAARQQEREAAERRRETKEQVKEQVKKSAAPVEKITERQREPVAEKKIPLRAVADAGEIPVRGRRVRGFGEPTGVGELRSRGVFFAAPEGSRVRVLAEGKVVFADWVRGYGNLLIVQHKGGYLSLYAQNEALLKSVGANVQRGEVVATAGRSGGERQTGVYVEVRRSGQPINPMRWSAWPKK